MDIVCLDLEGVLVPEIWIAFAEETGIPELKRTTRDEPDYNKLMNYRLNILREHGLGLKEIQETLCMVDYYGVGVLTVFVFYFLHGRKWWCFLGQLAALYWLNVELLGGLMYPVQLFGMEFELCQQGLALLALIPIWLYHGRQGYHSKPFQYLCYAFYPVHMLLLVVVLNFINR